MQTLNAQLWKRCVSCECSSVRTSTITGFLGTNTRYTIYKIRPFLKHVTIKHIKTQPFTKFEGLTLFKITQLSISSETWQNRIDRI